MVKKINKNRADVLGDRMKSYESITTKTTLIPNMPVYARIDGRAFHRLTKGLNKPNDIVFSTIMQTICQGLVTETGAILGYVQSDEISLGWEDFTKAPFEGKLFKLESVLASMASALFYEAIMVFTMRASENLLSEDKINSLTLLMNKLMKNPVCFDCRVFNVPNMDELANAFVWREQDAIRNSIQSYGQANFSHNQLQGKSCREIKNMLKTEKGIVWDELDRVLQRGLYIQKELYEEQISDEIWERIPDKKKPESRTVTRSKVSYLDLPLMQACQNKVGAYFYKEKPLIYAE